MARGYHSEDDRVDRSYGSPNGGVEGHAQHRHRERDERNRQRRNRPGDTRKTRECERASHGTSLRAVRRDLRDEQRHTSRQDKRAQQILRPRIRQQSPKHQRVGGHTPHRQGNAPDRAADDGQCRAEHHGARR